MSKNNNSERKMKKIDKRIEEDSPPSYINSSDYQHKYGGHINTSPLLQNLKKLRAKFTRDNFSTMSNALSQKIFNARCVGSSLNCNNANVIYTPIPVRTPAPLLQLLTERV